jgi:hypothetical protein
MSRLATRQRTAWQYRANRGEQTSSDIWPTIITLYPFVSLFDLQEKLDLACFGERTTLCLGRLLSWRSWHWALTSGDVAEPGRTWVARHWSPAPIPPPAACAITLPAVEQDVKQSGPPPRPERANAGSASSPLPSSELRGEDASRYCPVCSQRLESRRCKLICNRCGYYMSCADYV